MTNTHSQTSPSAGPDYLSDPNIKNIFFTGIGGISMSSLAAECQSRGYTVRGSDIVSSALTDRLHAGGIDVTTGHAAANVEGSDLLVYNARIRADNPEMLRAAQLGIPCVPRGELAGMLMSRYKTNVAVSGTHGKSTTTAIIAQALAEAGLRPAVQCGAIMPYFNGAYSLSGRGDYMVIEACEYCDSFLGFLPDICVVNWVEMDHPDYFADLQAVQDSFRKFVGRTTLRGHGAAVVDIDCANTGCVFGVPGVEYITYSSTGSPDADVRAANIEYSGRRSLFDIIIRGGRYARVSTDMPGTYNIANIIAAAAVAHRVGITGAQFANTISHFTNIARRFETKGRYSSTDPAHPGEITVVDDYAHHPTAINRLLDGAEKTGYNRIVAVFQPHTYTRTLDLFGQFAQSLARADLCFLADIYSATERDDGSVSSERLAAAIPGAVYVPSRNADFAELARRVKAATRGGDLLLCVGAGDIVELAPMLVEEK